MSGTWTRARARSTTCPRTARTCPPRPSRCRVVQDLVDLERHQGRPGHRRVLRGHHLLLLHLARAQFLRRPHRGPGGLPDGRRRQPGLRLDPSEVAEDARRRQRELRPRHRLRGQHLHPPRRGRAQPEHRHPGHRHHGQRLPPDRRHRHPDRRHRGDRRPPRRPAGHHQGHHGRQQRRHQGRRPVQRLARHPGRLHRPHGDHPQQGLRPALQRHLRRLGLGSDRPGRRHQLPGQLWAYRSGTPPRPAATTRSPTTRSTTS